jgi:hypothetical protein
MALVEVKLVIGASHQGFTQRAVGSELDAVEQVRQANLTRLLGPGVQEILRGAATRKGLPAP